MFQANPERFAVPLTGSGGLIAVLEASKPGRLPETDNPYIQNGAYVMDFEWDPFDNRVLAVGEWGFGSLDVTTKINLKTPTI